ncbi:MAG: large subunit ribosomal protein L9 [Chloroflexi bacterium]|jgi:large subunit ribosomal protein L9|nr:MAG: large subunit ribosomal protein L9 [Chloroflexota bacterium]
MKVIFVSDVAGSGQAGDIKEVKNGFARNFLLPKQLAVPATHDHLQRLDTIRKTGDNQRIKEQTEINALIENLTNITVNLSARTGPTGKFYGAVTSSHISEKLSSLIERQFDRRSIQLDQSIQEPGLYEVQLRFSYGISAALRVVVDAEGQEGSVETALAEKEEEKASLTDSQEVPDESTEESTATQEAPDESTEESTATQEAPDESTEESTATQEAPESEQGEESSI